MVHVTVTVLCIGCITVPPVPQFTCMYVQVQSLVQAWPYFEGLVVPLCDQPLQDVEQVQDQVQQLTQTVRVSVIDLGVW